MKTSLLCTGIILLGLSHLPLVGEEKSEDTPALDNRWAAVGKAIEEILNPTKQPASQFEAIAQIRSGLEGFDKAYASFVKAAPDDPRRWKARLFASKVAHLRPLVGMEEQGTSSSIVKEILASKGAPEAVRSEASATNLIERANAAIMADTREAWLKEAEAHLKAYPKEPLNPSVRGSLELIKPLKLAFTDVKGKKFDLKELRGKVVLIDFWATWCQPCVAEMPNVISVYEKWHPKGFEIVGISLDGDKEALQSFTEQRKMPWVQYFDGKQWQNEIAVRFSLTTVPTMWLLDKEGLVVDLQARRNLGKKVERLLEKE